MYRAKMHRLLLRWHMIVAWTSEKACRLSPFGSIKHVLTSSSSVATRSSRAAATLESAHIKLVEVATISRCHFAAQLSVTPLQQQQQARGEVYPTDWWRPVSPSPVRAHQKGSIAFGRFLYLG